MTPNLVPVACLVVLVVVGSGTARGATVPPARQPDFTTCEAAVRDHPERKESFRCFWEVARARKAWDEAARRLAVHLATDPSNPRAKLTLAWVEWDRGRSGVERLFSEAAEGFVAAHDANGEVFARLGLAEFLRNHGQPAVAAPEVERALTAARGAGDAILVARVRLDQASQAYARSDFGEALGDLREAEEIAVAKGARDVLAIVLGSKAYGWWALGMYRQSLDAYERLAVLYHEMGSQWGGTYRESQARYSIAVLSGHLFAQGQLERAEVVRRCREAVESAVSSGNRAGEADARLLLTPWLPVADAAPEIERTLALAKTTGVSQTIRFGMQLLARSLAFGDARRWAEGYRTINEAIDDARLAGDREDVARGLVTRAVMRFQTGPRRDWRQDSEAALVAIEQIRDLQWDRTIRARAFSPWAYAYYRFSGRLLAGLAVSEEPAGDLRLAFETIERLRARVLLECLDRAGARTEPNDSDAGVRRRTEVMSRLADLHRALASGLRREAERRAALERLDRLEAEEASARALIAGTVPAFARARPTAFATLAEIQSRLAPDQALLSFQLAPTGPDAEDPSANGGSWLVLITKAGARAYALPRRGTIEDAVAIFVGLCRRRDGSEARAAATLYRELLAVPLREAGPNIRRLVVIPDACLNRLPFGSLREGPEPGPPLALRCEITVAPSATLWLRWKTGTGRARSAPRALALADPETDDPTSPRARDVDASLARLKLGRLPRARSEAATLARGIGPGSLVLVGAEASEAALKRVNFDTYDVLHFATHAVIDEGHPDRSAILLAPGSKTEDGRLELREIVQLPLDRQVVVLSNCRSASGTEIEGEGVLGLARAFFQAGAAVVVGTLWPVRDADMDAFMGVFARELARGRSVAAAQREAVGLAVRAGLPAEAWAGPVVLGDGDVVPVWNGQARHDSPWVLIAVGTGLAVLLVGFVAWMWVRGARARRVFAAGGE